RDSSIAEQQVNTWYRAARAELVRRLGVQTYADVPKVARDRLAAEWREALVKAKVGLGTSFGARG
ncbi:MAG: hypothetical protein ACRDLY_15895, partial [Thermoleophilaceae bacterium]